MYNSLNLTKTNTLINTIILAVVFSPPEIFAESYGIAFSARIYNRVQVFEKAPENSEILTLISVRKLRSPTVSQIFHYMPMCPNKYYDWIILLFQRHTLTWPHYM